MNKSFLSLSLLLVAAIIFGTFGYLYSTGISPWLQLLVGLLVGALSYIAFSYILKWLGYVTNKVPNAIFTSLLALFATAILVKELGLWMREEVYFGGIGGIALCVLMIGISLQFLRKKAWAKHWRGLAILGIILPLLLLAYGIHFLTKTGHDPYAEKLSSPFEQAEAPLLSASGLASPAEKGEFDTKTFSYGHGNDKHRKVYAEDISYATSTVDASILLPEWKGKKKKWRERYLGFGASEFPLNGVVEMPKGDGPFPIVLIVHGNHDMIDYSDEGYHYLQHMLAGLGMIAVSVDENFINAHWSGDFRGKEMPTRAWLLLKHLEQWAAWNADKTHDLFQKIDMDRIMLIGHSRGGEAVSIAAAFNELDYFPDNAKEKFDFHFQIKGIVSIAPTDYRYHRQIKLKDLNYLSLQGSYDADENSFWGMRPYHRLQFSDSSDCIKAGVYIHRANHGQFNSSWGRTDFGAPNSWLFNTQPLLSARDQMLTAQVFIGAFAEAVLKENKAFLPIFQQVEKARDWLPATHYLTHFQDGDDLILQDFEEDIDIAHGAKGISLETKNLAIWREEKLGTRGNGSQENNAVILGWDREANLKDEFLPSYSLVLDQSLAVTLDSTSRLLISIAAGDHTSLPKSKKDREEPVLDFHIQLIDSAGNIAQTTVSQTKKIAPRLHVQFMKTQGLSDDMVGKAWEIQLESFALPLHTFENMSGQLDINSIQVIKLVFDTSVYGVIAVDDIGFSPN